MEKSANEVWHIVFRSEKYTYKKIQAKNFKNIFWTYIRRKQADEYIVLLILTLKSKTYFTVFETIPFTTRIITKPCIVIMSLNI